MNLNLIFIILALFLIGVYITQLNTNPKVIFKNKFIHFDMFSIIHIIFGFTLILGLILLKINPKSRFLYLLVGLIAFEIYEYFTTNHPLFSLNNTWDVIFGLIGGYLSANYLT